MENIWKEKQKMSSERKRERERVVHTSGFILWAVIFLLDFLSLSLSFFLFLSPLGL